MSEHWCYYPNKNDFRTRVDLVFEHTKEGTIIKHMGTDRVVTQEEWEEIKANVRARIGRLVKSRW